MKIKFVPPDVKPDVCIRLSNDEMWKLLAVLGYDRTNPGFSESLKQQVLHAMQDEEKKRTST